MLDAIIIRHEIANIWVIRLLFRTEYVGTLCKHGVR
jgi:hypothetical protein